MVEPGVREGFLEAILHGQRRQALDVALEALHSRVSLVDIYSEVFQDSLYRVGEMWESNRITVAEEHLATAITQFVVAQVYARFPVPAPSRGRLVITGVEGELHQVGPNLVADVMELDGWDVRFLGTNTPLAGVLRLVEEYQPTVLGISATMVFSITRVHELIHQVGQRLGSRAPEIVVGGGAFRTACHRWRDLGAAGCALDLHSARAQINRFSRVA